MMMKKTMEILTVLLLLISLLTVSVAGIVTDDGTDPDDDGNVDEERPEEPEDRLGEGEHAVRIALVNEKTGEPVGDANIYGWSESPDSSREPQKVTGITDENGNITFHLDPGMFHFEVERKDYFGLRLTLEVEGPMDHAINITPYPEASASVMGVVSDSVSEEPISGVMISFYLIRSPLFPEDQGQPEAPPIGEEPEDDAVEDENKEKEEERPQSEPVPYWRIPYIWKDISTRDDGKYSIELIPGTYEVNAYIMYKNPMNWDSDGDFDEEEKPREERPPEDDGEMDDDRRDPPSENDMDLPREYYPFHDTITLDVNETLTLDIFLKPLPPVDSVIKGYVTDEDGNPVPDAYIYVYSKGPKLPEEIEEEKAVKDDEEDREKGGDGSGTSEGGETTPAYDDVEVYYDQSYGGENSAWTNENGFYELRLRAGHYTMHVTPPYYYSGDDGWEEEGKPLPGDDVYEVHEEEKRNDDGKAESSSSSGEESQSDGDEEYEKNENPEPANGYYGMERTLSFKLEAKEILWKNVTLKNPPEKNAKIDGKVLDKDTGEPVTNAAVSIYGGEMFMYTAVDTEEDGSFSIKVYPGYYYIDVRVTEDLYLTPEDYEERYEGTDAKAEELGGMYKVKTPYFPYSTEIKVGSGETAELEILLKPKPKDLVEIEGFVRDAETRAVLTYYPVEATIVTDQHVLHNSTWTDETGHYVIHVPLGDIILTVGKDYGIYEEYRMDGTADGNEEKNENPNERKDYFPGRFTTKATDPGKITKDFDLEERKYPADETVSATFSGGSGSDYGYVEMFAFDVERGVHYREYGYENKERSRSGTLNVEMSLPDGTYKTFAVEWSDGDMSSLTAVYDLTVFDGELQSLSLNFEETPSNGAIMDVEFTSKDRIKVSSDITLGGPALMMKATLESKMGNGDMDISAGELELMGRYASIEGDPMIKPVIALAGVAFAIVPDSVKYEFDDGLVGPVGSAPIDVKISFEMEALGKVDLTEEISFDFNIKGPYAMDVECDITLPEEMKLEDGTRKVSRSMTIKPGNYWRDGLSDDFQEEAESNVPKASGGDSADDDEWSDIGTDGGGELGSDEGLSLTFFSSEADEDKGSKVDQKTYVVLGAIVLLVIVFVVLFVVLKRKKRAEEETEEEPGKKTD